MEFRALVIPLYVAEGAVPRLAYACILTPELCPAVANSHDHSGAIGLPQNRLDLRLVPFRERKLEDLLILVGMVGQAESSSWFPSLR